MCLDKLDGCAICIPTPYDFELFSGIANELNQRLAFVLLETCIAEQFIEHCHRSRHDLILKSPQNRLGGAVEITINVHQADVLWMLSGKAPDCILKATNYEFGICETWSNACLE